MRRACAITLLCVGGSALSSETQKYSYDALGRLVKVERTGASIAQTQITYDAAGNRSCFSVNGVGSGAVVANFSFECPAINGTAMSPASDSAGVSFGARAGIAANGSGLGPNAPDGTQVAFIQARSSGATGQFDQTVSGLQSGTPYRVQFKAAVQSGRQANAINLQVNGATVGSWTPAAAFSTSPSFIFTASSATATLRFISTTTTVNTGSVIDRVEVVPN